MTQSGRLDGKVAVITGAASGIGRAIAELFAHEGARVLLTDLDAAAAASAMAALSSGPHLSCALDVTDEPSWQAALDHAIDTWGRIDILVNNAGIPSATSLEDTSLADWRRVIAINLDGTFLGCKHAVLRMKLRGGGSIVNVSSVGALKASTIGPAYGAAKAGVWNLTRTVALYCARSGYGIRCNSLHPGLTLTPMMEQVSSETLDRLRSGIPLQTLGEPLDMAQAALYLASDEARYTTGTALVVDGGYSL